MKKLGISRGTRLKKIVWFIFDLLRFVLLCVLRCRVMSFNFLMYLRLLYLMYDAEIKLHVLKLLPSLNIVMDRVERPIP